jgi:hypothetical protein
VFSIAYQKSNGPSVLLSGNGFERPFKALEVNKEQSLFELIFFTSTTIFHCQLFFSYSNSPQPSTSSHKQVFPRNITTT